MNTEQKNLLLALARAVLENKLLGCKHDLKTYRCVAFDDKCGLFVTLTLQGKLRGCIGQIEAEDTIYNNTIQLVRSAAFKDRRFSPLTGKELRQVLIEISLLTKPKELIGSDIYEKIDQIRPHIDGVVLKSGCRKSTFLPQVWESISTHEAFISGLCCKTGLPEDYWRNQRVELSVYQVEHFQEAGTNGQ